MIQVQDIYRRLRPRGQSSETEKLHGTIESELSWQESNTIETSGSSANVNELAIELITLHHTASRPRSMVWAGTATALAATKKSLDDVDPRWYSLLQRSWKVSESGRLSRDGYDKSMRELEDLTGPETNNVFLIEIDGSKT